MSICLYVGKNVSVDVLLRKKRRFGEIAPFWHTAVLACDFALTVHKARSFGDFGNDITIGGQSKFSKCLWTP